MTREQADCLMQLLDISTQGNWPHIAEQITYDYGWTPEQVIDAWKTLADIAGVDGYPEESDF